MVCCNILASEEKEKKRGREREGKEKTRMLVLVFLFFFFSAITKKKRKAVEMIRETDVESGLYNNKDQRGLPGQDDGWEGLFMAIYSSAHGNCANPSRTYSSNIDL